MENYSVYEDIANRTGGDIYVGVVGPVRTGKSTFIRRIMETLVLPQVPEEKLAEMRDELPQAGAGKTVMTTEPKFVPAKGVDITVQKGAKVCVRLVDCVGFSVEGAGGFDEDGRPRLVKTPWITTPGREHHRLILTLPLERSISIFAMPAAYSLFFRYLRML